MFERFFSQELSLQLGKNNVLAKKIRVPIYSYPKVDSVRKC